MKMETFMTLPTNSKERKNVPVASGCLDYFPDAIAAVATVSRIGNEQHNPGQPLHWDRSKSTDHDDALMRHFLERGTLDSDGQLHRAKVAWRALAALQEEIESEQTLLYPLFAERRRGGGWKTDRRVDKENGIAHYPRRITVDCGRRYDDIHWYTGARKLYV
jgi:hypothetical protein